MFLLKPQFCCTKRNLTIVIFKQSFMKISTSTKVFNSTQTAPNTNTASDTLEQLILKYESKLLYNSVIERKKIRLGSKKNNERVFKLLKYHEKLRNGLAEIQPIPLSLKYLTEDDKENFNSECSTEHKSTEGETLQFPYNFDTNRNVLKEEEIVNIEHTTNNYTNTNNIKNEILQRNKLYSECKNWMSAYDNYENDLIECDYSEINYGTPDPRAKISNVPCGGCGALLHCKDTGIPGYIPSEIFKNYRQKGGVNLEAILCQRCHFLNEYNIALQVSVSADDYPKILATIRGKKALAVVIVDLMDFPCSIWPGISDILGTHTPIFVVGNKVDLLPRDGKQFLNRVKKNLLNHLRISGFGTSNIVGAALVSAKTGYGIEHLITSLFSLRKHKGDVYLIGCTNVGKSSLFNALLQSDYCKIQAADLIQRATISHWPGTTLNMLKFPITRPSAQRIYLRSQRIMQYQRSSANEYRLRQEFLKTDNSAKYATLIGRIGQTFTKTKDTDNATKDCFSVVGQANATGMLKMGINEKHPDYALSRWCFDTPGVVQPDQILHLLTIEELMNTIPKEIIRPETFCVKPGTSLFIAGLARLDYLEGFDSVRLTVFRSNELPITVCSIEEASYVYKEFLGTMLFKIPVQDPDRLQKWPGLESAPPLTVTGINSRISSNDIVLSSAGWVAINCKEGKSYKFQAWTPERRGIHLRDSLLPEAVTLRGPRISHSIAYRMHTFI